MHFYSCLCKSKLLSEWFNRSTRHIISAWGFLLCFLLLLALQLTLIVSISRGLWEHMKSSIAVLHNSTERFPSIIIYINMSLAASLHARWLRKMHSGSREPPRPLTDNPNAHSLFERDNRNKCKVFCSEHRTGTLTATVAKRIGRQLNANNKKKKKYMDCHFQYDDGE